jgi:4a-hydroxytetrahydrobiopterin dehydratase
MKLIDYTLDNLPDHQTTVTVDQYKELMIQIDQWQIVNKQGVDQLFCVFKCNNFVSAMSFAQAITDLAEQVDHHPTLLIEWGSVSVSWWSHNLKGLHINDFIMAAKTQQIYTAQ